MWRADLTTVTEEMAELLCEEESARAARLLSNRDRRLWTHSRGVLRSLLGRYLHEDPGILRFSSGANGKPRLRGHGLSFNLSHSGRLALYAIAENGEVGVDVEVARRAINETALAARTFGSAEAGRLAGLDPVSRQQEFLRLWVRHEARLKCRGTGIGDMAPRASAREPWITELDVGVRAAAAVAADAPANELYLWDWPV